MAKILVHSFVPQKERQFTLDLSQQVPDIPLPCVHTTTRPVISDGELTVESIWRLVCCLAVSARVMGTDAVAVSFAEIPRPKFVVVDERRFGGKCRPVLVDSEARESHLTNLDVAVL